MRVMVTRDCPRGPSGGEKKMSRISFPVTIIFRAIQQQQKQELVVVASIQKKK